MSNVPQPDPYGAIPPDAPPIEVQLEEAKAIGNALRHRFLHTSRILVELISEAGKVQAGKQYGCDRCIPCTVHTSRLIDRWLTEVSWPDKDPAFLSLTHFVGFPRALVRIVEACLRNMAPTEEGGDGRCYHDTAREDVLVTRLAELCDWADHQYTERMQSFLPFARVAAALEYLTPSLSKSLGHHGNWPPIEKKIESLLQKTGNVEGYLGHGKYFETRWIGYDHEEEHPAEKRIEGGGYLRRRVATDEPEPEPWYVIDFSKTHIYAVVNEPVYGDAPLRNWEFFPTQRELPFTVDLMAEQRKDENIPVAVKEGSLKRGCGRYYQLLRICDIKPNYYYLALCASFLSKHADLAGERLVDTYDWPKPPILSEHI